MSNSDLFVDFVDDTVLTADQLNSAFRVVQGVGTAAQASATSAVTAAAQAEADAQSALTAAGNAHAEATAASTAAAAAHDAAVAAAAASGGGAITVSSGGASLSGIKTLDIEGSGVGLVQSGTTATLTIPSPNSTSIVGLPSGSNIRTRPVASAFQKLNWRADTTSIDHGANGPLTLTVHSNGDWIQGFEQDMPSGPFTLRVKMRMAAPNWQYYNSGIVLRAPASNQWIYWLLNTNGSAGINCYNNGPGSANYVGGSGNISNFSGIGSISLPIWDTNDFFLKSDGSNLFFGFSTPDGLEPLYIGSMPLNGFGTLTKVGFGVSVNAQGTFTPGIAQLWDFALTTP